MVDPVPTSDELLRQQVVYYRGRAPTYDDWWERRGQYAGGPELGAAWEAERRAYEASVARWLERERPRSVLEVAGGTGNLTTLIAPHVESMTVVDSSPEVLEINRAKLGRLASRITYRVLDVFDWTPDTPHDAVAMGFWMTHVPTDRWDEFWATVRSALAPGGTVWIGDNAEPELGWEAGVVERPPDPDRLTTDGTIDRRTDQHQRSLPDGSTYQIVKRFYSPTDLVAALARTGFDAAAETTDWAFITAVARPTDDVPPPVSGPA